MKELLVIAAVVGAAGVSSACRARPIHDCVPAAERAATALIERGPAIGQVYVSGTAFAIDPRKLRLEVDVFGPQTFVYRVDVTLDDACYVQDIDTWLINDPYGGRW